jgi:hypothetical protein
VTPTEITVGILTIFATQVYHLVFERFFGWRVAPFYNKSCGSD